MSVFTKDSLWRKAGKRARQINRRSVLGTSLATGATIVATSLASARASAARRREEDS